MRLVLPSILLGLLLTAGCSESGDDIGTGDSILDKAKATVESTTDAVGDMVVDTVDMVQDAGQAASDVVDTVKEKGQAVIDSANDMQSSVAAAVSDRSQDAMDGASDMAADTDEAVDIARGAASDAWITGGAAQF